MYVTLEPCAMCAGAIVQARIPEVMIGTQDLKNGATNTILNVLENEKLNHRAELKFGIFEEECSETFVIVSTPVMPFLDFILSIMSSAFAIYGLSLGVLFNISTFISKILPPAMVTVTNAFFNNL